MTDVAPPVETRRPPQAVQASVTQRQMVAVVSEMATMLMRSSRSPIFSQLGDLVTVLFDSEGRTLAQAELAAIIACGAQPGLRAIVDYFGEDIREGDVFIHNDVFSGGNQNADLGVFLPVFADGQLIAWTSCKGHMADIGGMTAGGYDPRAREVWQEAIRIPPTKIYERGMVRRDVWDLIAANVRLGIVMEDVQAMVGACVVGRRRLTDLVNRYGLSDFEAQASFLIESSERAMRAEIRRWPDGFYSGESWMVSDGIDSRKRYRVACDIDIRGDNITIDFSRTDDQARGFTNMPASSAMGAVRIALLMLAAAGGVEVVTNDGFFAPVRVVLREGSLLNPRFPAATIFGNQMCDEVVECIMSALAEALPDRVTAGWAQHLSAAVHGEDPRRGRAFVALMAFQRTGAGAMQSHDGWDALGFTGTVGQMRAMDPEVFEFTSPHTLLYHEYRPDSAGAGEWRGGLGTRTAWRCEGEGEVGVSIGDDVDSEGADPPRGLFGGEDGTLNNTAVTFADGRSVSWGSKELLELPPGTIVSSDRGGGGGYGYPWRRPWELVAGDVRDGLLSLAKARMSYGVVIDSEGLVVDVQETELLRKSMADKAAFS